jgi:uncharacterized protein YcbX
MAAPRLAALHVYPVKALGGIAPSEADVEPWGLARDRRWLLATPDGAKVTQREQPRLALASAEPLSGGRIRVTAPGMEPLEAEVPEPSAGTVTVEVWRDKVEAVPSAAEGSAWFSDYLGTEVRLLHMDAPEMRRGIAPQYARPGETVSFADAFPLLLTTVASLNALNSLIEQGDHADEGPLPMNRFRPNAVIEGTAPWAEDEWRRVRIGEVTFRMAKQCGRCVVTTTDQTSAERGKEPLRTLARHRRFGDQLVFGHNMIPENTGRVHSGAHFEVLD